MITACLCLWAAPGSHRRKPAKWNESNSGGQGQQAGREDFRTAAQPRLVEAKSSGSGRGKSEFGEDGSCPHAGARRASESTHDHTAERDTMQGQYDAFQGDRTARPRRRRRVAAEPTTGDRRSRAASPWAILNGRTHSRLSEPAASCRRFCSQHVWRRRDEPAARLLRLLRLFSFSAAATAQWTLVSSSSRQSARLAGHHSFWSFRRISSCSLSSSFRRPA